MEHILVHCVEYIDIRHLYFNVNTVRELFDTVPPVDHFIYSKSWPLVFNLITLYIKSSPRYLCSYFIFVPNLVEYVLSHLIVYARF